MRNKALSELTQREKNKITLYDLKMLKALNKISCYSLNNIYLLQTRKTKTQLKHIRKTRKKGK